MYKLEHYAADSDVNARSVLPRVCWYFWNTSITKCIVNLDWIHYWRARNCSSGAFNLNFLMLLNIKIIFYNKRIRALSDTRITGNVQT